VNAGKSMHDNIQMNTFKSNKSVDDNNTYTNLPSVSVIICTKNRSECLVNTIESILSVELLPTQSVELIIVDNGSTDKTSELIHSYTETPISIKYLYEPVPGKCRSLNRAISESMSDILLFTDDDVLVPSDWIIGMSSMYADSSVHAVQGRIHLHDAIKRPWMEDMHLQFLAVFDYPNASSLTGANMALRRNSILEIGGFDETFGPGTERGFGDDTIVGIRMTKRFGPIPIYKGAPVVHCPFTNRLTRSAMFNRIDRQVDVELAIRKEQGIGIPRQAFRPVWLNQLLFWGKVCRERLLHPDSPATQAEICARRSVALSLAIQHSTKG
jgi:glycosyltransferase involved in cell wall biosynthesis